MKPIFIAASPNTEKDDIKLAIKLLTKPKDWFNQKNTVDFEKQVERFLGNGVKAVAMDSARSAFYLILKEYGVGPGDEVIIPSFSCLVVANPIVWLGATPIYVDVDPKTFNMDLNSLKKKLSKKTKAVLVQHTFGTIIDVQKVRNIVGKNIKLIEDTAHTFGSSLNNKNIGTMGDAAIVTFGIEKVISTVRGGMAITKDESLYKKLKDLQSEWPQFSKKRVKISLANPIFWSLVEKFYYFGIGKLTVGRILTWLGHKFDLLGNMIEKCEYKTFKPTWFPAQMPGALAKLGMLQLTKLEKMSLHRKKVVEVYKDVLKIKESDLGGTESYFLRYPVLVDDANKVLLIVKSKRVVLGDWYQKILYAPKDALLKLNYHNGDTPIAEKLSKHIINLPTHIKVSEERAREIAELVKPYMQSLEFGLPAVATAKTGS